MLSRKREKSWKEKSMGSTASLSSEVGWTPISLKTKADSSSQRELLSLMWKSRDQVSTRKLKERLVRSTTGFRKVSFRGTITKPARYKRVT